MEGINAATQRGNKGGCMKGSSLDTSLCRNVW